MSFITPTAFVFAAALPVVVLFYLLKRKRIVKLVSSTLLWQKYLAETQASAPFQRLRHNWLLILQLLMLTLVIFALSRPYFAGPTRLGRMLVVILDASASMQSTDEAPSRFEKARAEALKWVDSLRDSDQMVILEAAAGTQVKQSPTSNKSALRRALQACSVTDGPTRLTEALKLGEILIRDQAGAEIHLFSDGAATGLNDFENKGLRLVYHRIGRRSDNVGIVSLDVRAHPEDAAKRALYANVVNFSTNAQQTGLELRFDNQLLESRTLTLKPKESSPQVFAATQSRNGIFTLQLTLQDDLAADNRASIVSLLPEPVKVLLVSRGNRFLEKALRAVPGVELSLASTLTDTAAAFDLAVLDDVSPAIWPVASVLAIHTVNTNWFEGWSTVSSPGIVAWKNTHPLLRFVNFDNVQIGESLAVKTNTWGIPLVESTQTPLILAGELNRQRIVWVGFDTLQSTWPLRVGFPIFIANAVEWLNPAAASASQMLVRAGDPFRLALAHPMTNTLVTFKLPSGVEKQVAIDTGSREVVLGDTVKQGIYQMQLGTNHLAFCVNVMDAAESDISPRSELALGKYDKVAATQVRRANLEFWRWLAAIGLAVLLFEWWFYHRRTA